MRSVGVFGGFSQGIHVPESSLSLLRNLSKERVYQNIRPKVGVVSSSERAHARGFDIKKTNHNASSHDVLAALRRVRNVSVKLVPAQIPIVELPPNMDSA